MNDLLMKYFKCYVIRTAKYKPTFEQLIEWFGDIPDMVKNEKAGLRTHREFRDLLNNRIKIITQEYKRIKR